MLNSPFLNNSSLPLLYRGVVVDNEDPQRLGKCKVRVPTVNGAVSSNILQWARPITNMSTGDGRYTSCIPNNGDIVWVMFEGGNKEYPVYIGGTHAAGNAEIDTNKVVLYLENDNQIVYDREKETYTLNVDKNSITLSKDNILLKSVDSLNSIKLSEDGIILSGDIQIEGNITVGGNVRELNDSQYNVILGDPSYDEETPCPSGGSGSGGSAYSPGEFVIPEGTVGDENFQRMLAEAQKYLGVGYAWGGSTPAGFDCSGFVCYVINNCGNGWSIPRTDCNGILDKCDRISASEAKPGDLFFLQGTQGPKVGATHIGIYCGGSTIIHCGKSHGVCFRSIDTNYYRTNFYCYGRLKVNN